MPDFEVIALGSFAAVARGEGTIVLAFDRIFLGLDLGVNRVATCPVPSGFDSRYHGNE